MTNATQETSLEQRPFWGVCFGCEQRTTTVCSICHRPLCRTCERDHMETCTAFRPDQIAEREMLQAQTPVVNVQVETEED